MGLLEFSWATISLIDIGVLSISVKCYTFRKIIFSPRKIAAKTPMNPYRYKILNQIRKVTKNTKKLPFGNFLRRNLP